PRSNEGWGGQVCREMDSLRAHTRPHPCRRGACPWQGALAGTPTLHNHLSEEDLRHGNLPDCQNAAHQGLADRSRTVATGPTAGHCPGCPTPAGRWLVQWCGNRTVTHERVAETLTRCAVPLQWTRNHPHQVAPAHPVQ